MRFFIRILSFLAGCFFCIQLIAQPIDTIDNRKKIGLVLSGGGAKGLAHVGVLKVLEEKNIQIDYIGGTSMGAIVGGFYAMGYSASEIERMIKEQDWEKIFDGELDREKIPLFERSDIERYILSFPIRKKGIGLPGGIIQNKNILTILSKTAKQYNSTINFKKDLSIPFFCIAADLISGEEIVLEKGNLPSSIYASMAIPAVFPPLEMDDKLLVDGGLVNNFPIRKMKEKSVDIIIGVDVQHGMRSREEIESIRDIVNQMITLRSNTDTTKIDLCDIYIKPEIDTYKASDFNMTDELVKLGEEAARKKLLHIVGSENIKLNIRKNQLSSKYLIREITVSGLSHMTSRQFLKIFKIKLPKIFTEKKIKSLIQRIYEHYNLTSLDYSFEGENKDILHFRIKEKTGKTFNIGLHFNQNQGLNMLFNTSFYNFLINQSKLSLDVKLSQHPRFTVKYNIQSTRFFNLGLMGDINNYNFKFFEKKGKSISFDFTSYKFDINTYILLKNSYSLGTGIRLEHFNTDLKRLENLFNGNIMTGTEEDFFTNTYAFLGINTFDDNSYPNKGQNLYVEVKIINNKNIANESIIAYLEWQRAIYLGKKFITLPSFYGRATLTNNTPPQFYKNYLKGINKSSFFDHYLPFVGSKFIQETKPKTLIFGLDLRYELFKNHYLIAKTNMGLFASRFDNLFDEKNLNGYGLTYSYNSLFGPIELTVAGSNVRNNMVFYLTAGFWF